jgi:hypothetical protein
MLVQCSITLHLIKIFLGFEDPHGWWHAGFISSTSEAATVDDAQSFRQTPFESSHLCSQQRRKAGKRRARTSRKFAGFRQSGESSRPSTGKGQSSGRWTDYRLHLIRFSCPYQYGLVIRLASYPFALSSIARRRK